MAKIKDLKKCINVEIYIWKFSMFQSKPVHKSSRKVYRTSIALLMCHFSPPHMCANCHIWCEWWNFSLTLKILTCQTRRNHFNHHLFVFFCLFCFDFVATHLCQLGINKLKCVCILFVEYVLHIVQKANTCFVLFCLFHPHFCFQGDYTLL